jgi:hypothetical protein
MRRRPRRWSPPSISLAVDHQEREIRQQIAYDKAHTMVTLTHSIWKDVRREVSRYALNKVYEQLQKARHLDVGATCSGRFRTTMGLPCSHEIKELLSSGRSLTLDHFHQHWWLVKPEDPADAVVDQQPTFEDALTQLQSQHENLPPHQQRLLEDQLVGLSQQSITPVQNPLPVRSRGRPLGATAGSSTTRRELSAFELVEARTRGPRKCGECRMEGHDRRNCHQLQAGSASNV